jgi:hypothetical protein
MGVAVMSDSPVERAVILYLIYYWLPAFLSINSSTERKNQSATELRIARNRGAFCPEA